MHKRQTIILWIVITFTTLYIAAIFVLHYQTSAQNIIRLWQNKTDNIAADINSYITMPQDAVKISAQKLNGMIENQTPVEEVLEYLQNETEVYASIINDNTTGVYAYYGGEYLDGSRWVPPADYDATTRPWYVEGIAAKGNLVIVQPFLNLQTSTMTMSFSQMLKDGESVVSMDVFLDGVQNIIEESIKDQEIEAAFVLDNNGFIIAHSDVSEVGKNYSAHSGYGKELDKIINSGSKGDSLVITGQNNTRIFISPVNDEWNIVLILRSEVLFYSIRYIYMISTVTVLAFLYLVIGFFRYLRSKQQETEHRDKEINAIANIYEDVYQIDFRTGRAELIQMEGQVTVAFDKNSLNYRDLAEGIISKSSAESKEMLRAFLDPDSIIMRLNNIETITHEFIDANEKWHCLRFIVVDRDSNENATNALLAVESIDEDRKRQEKLKRLSETDLMTGLYNRGSGEAHIKELLSEGKKGMFLLLDADKFKSVNDNYGHSVGDKVIVAIADVLRTVFPVPAVVFRLGGDEFAVFAEYVTNIEEGMQAAGDLFRGIEEIRIAEMKGESISISVGMTFTKSEDNTSFDLLYSRADAGAYLSKEVKGNSFTIR